MKDPAPFDYATPEPRQRKDAMDYYREPPAIASWTLSQFLITIVASIITVIVIICLVLWWINSAFEKHGA